MPSGVVHSMTSCAAAGITGATLAAFNAPIEAIAFVPIGCLAGIILTPDLDQETLTFSEYKLMNNRNRVIALCGWLLALAFLPYAWSIPHRHWLSHGLIISTLIRLIYLAVVLAIPAWMFFGLDIMVYVPLVVKSSVFHYFLTGLLISDILHGLMDLTSTGLKRKFNRRMRR